MNDPRESLKDIHFPRAGIDTSCPFGAQPNRQTDPDTNEWSRTCIIGKNVRGWDPFTTRNRGGSRTGLVRYINAEVPGEYWTVQELNVITTTEGTPVQQSQSGRVVTLIAVSQGNVYYADAGATDWSTATNNSGETPPLNYTGIMYSAANQQKLYFADGINWCYYNPPTHSIETWTASAGSLPEDGDGNTPRLIATWRGRTVLSGLLGDPQNWFMSAVDDPTDFDYFPLSPSPTQAVAGNNGPAGQIGDVVTGLISYTDDILIFLCDHSIWMLRGDPMLGGQIDQISSVIGGAWGQAWTMDPFGNVYFFSNRMGVYRLKPGEQPVRVSQQIDSLLVDVDTGNNSIRLLWNDRFQGFHVFITPLDAPGPTTHYFYEARTGAWFSDEFADHDMDPICCIQFDGNLPDDRVALVGCWDGFVRAVSVNATDDDGKKISSEVLIGPFLTANMDDVLLKDLQAILGETSGDVTFEILAGDTAEAAYQSEPIVTGTWMAGRNYNDLVRIADHAIYIRIRSDNQWAMESIRIRIADQGKVRRRTGPRS